MSKIAVPKASAQSTAVAVQPLSQEDFMALLQQSGMVPQGGGDFHRMILRNGMLVTDADTPNEEQWPPPRGGAPVFLVRVVKPPVFFNGIFCGDKEFDSEGRSTGAFDARKINRPELNGRFVKKYDDPAEQAADSYAILADYEAVSAAANQRGAFKADIQVQIVPESGELTGDEPVYTLTMSATSAMDWRGTVKNPNGGTVSEKNFIVQLGEFAQAKAIEAGGDRQAVMGAVLDAMTALRLGNVVAAVYLKTAQSEDKSRTWTVIAFQPVHVETGEAQPALSEGSTDLAADPDEVPI